MGSFEITLTFHSGSLFIYVGYFIWGTRFKSIDSALFETTHLAGCWQVHDSKRSRNPILNVIFILSDLFQLTFKNFSTSLYSFSCHLVQLITLIFLPIVFKQYDTSALIASFTAHAIQSMPSGKAPGFPDLLWSSTKSSHPSWRQTFCWMFPFLLHLNLENCINHVTTGLLSLIIVPAFNETRLFCLYWTRVCLR